MDEENVGPLAELLVDYKEAKKAAELAPDDDELKRAYRTKKKLYKQAKKSAGQTDTVELGDAVSQATHAHKVPKELRPPPGQSGGNRGRRPPSAGAEEVSLPGYVHTMPEPEPEPEPREQDLVPATSSVRKGGGSLSAVRATAVLQAERVKPPDWCEKGAIVRINGIKKAPSARKDSEDGQQDDEGGEEQVRFGRIQHVEGPKITVRTYDAARDCLCQICEAKQASYGIAGDTRRWCSQCMSSKKAKQQAEEKARDLEKARQLVSNVDAQHQQRLRKRAATNLQSMRSATKLTRSATQRKLGKLADAIKARQDANAEDSKSFRAVLLEIAEHVPDQEMHTKAQRAISAMELSSEGVEMLLTGDVETLVENLLTAEPEAERLLSRTSDSGTALAGQGVWQAMLAASGSDLKRRFEEVMKDKERKLYLKYLESTCTGDAQQLQTAAEERIPDTADAAAEDISAASKIRQFEVIEFYANFKLDGTTSAPVDQTAEDTDQVSGPAWFTICDGRDVVKNEQRIGNITLQQAALEETTRIFKPFSWCRAGAFATFREDPGLGFMFFLQEYHHVIRDTIKDERKMAKKLAKQAKQAPKGSDLKRGLTQGQLDLELRKKKKLAKAEVPYTGMGGVVNRAKEIWSHLKREHPERKRFEDRAGEYQLTEEEVHAALQRSDSAMLTKSSSVQEKKSDKPVTGRVRQVEFDPERGRPDIGLDGKADRGTDLVNIRLYKAEPEPRGTVQDDDSGEEENSFHSGCRDDGRWYLIKGVPVQILQQARLEEKEAWQQATRKWMEQQEADELHSAELSRGRFYSVAIDVSSVVEKRGVRGTQRTKGVCCEKQCDKCEGKRETDEATDENESVQQSDYRRDLFATMHDLSLKEQNLVHRILEYARTEERAEALRRAVRDYLRLSANPLWACFRVAEELREEADSNDDVRESRRLRDTSDIMIRLATKLAEHLDLPSNDFAGMAAWLEPKLNYSPATPKNVFDDESLCRKVGRYLTLLCHGIQIRKLGVVTAGPLYEAIILQEHDFVHIEWVQAFVNHIRSASFTIEDEFTMDLPIGPRHGLVGREAVEKIRKKAWKYVMSNELQGHKLFFEGLFHSWAGLQVPAAHFRIPLARYLFDLVVYLVFLCCFTWGIALDVWHANSFGTGELIDNAGYLRGDNPNVVVFIRVWCWLYLVGCMEREIRQLNRLGARAYFSE